MLSAPDTSQAPQEAILIQEASTELSDLPDTVLEAIFAFAASDTPSAVPALCLTCQRWRDVWQHSSIPLPQLSLTGPLPQAWMQQHARKFHKLTLRRCESVALLASCTNLQRLLLEDCRKLCDLSPLVEGAPQLHTLLLRTLRHLTDLRPVAQLPALTTLGIDRCFTRDLTPLSKAPKLDTLHLSCDCFSIMAVTFPPVLPSLKKLRLMAALQDLTPLAAYTGLTSLEVYAVSVYDLSPLSHLTRLQEMDLHQLQEEQGALDMAPLSLLVNLTSLGLQGSDADVVETTPWPRLSGLCRLDLHGSRVTDQGLRSLGVLAGSLRSLDLSQARELRDVGPLSVLTGLSELVLTGSKNVRDLRPIMQLAGLRKGVGGTLKKP